MHRSSLRSFLLNGSYQGLANLYYLVVRAIYVVLFARILGVELYGYYAYANNWYVIWLPVAAWGMQELMISQYARCEPGRRSALTDTGLGLRLLFSVGLALLVVLAAIAVEPDPLLKSLIILYSQGILARGVSGWFCGLFMARERSVYWLAITVPSLTVEVLLALWLAYQQAGLVAIAIAQCAVWWATAFVSWLVYRNRFDRVGIRLDGELVRFYVYNGFSLASAAFILGCLGPGLLIIYRYLITDLSLLGEIAFVLQLFVILSQIIRVVSNSALPMLSRDSASGRHYLGGIAAAVCKQSLYLGGAMFVLCYWLLEPAVVRLVGEDFASAAGLFARHSWLLIPLCLMHAMRAILITTRHQHLYLLSILAGAAALGLQILFHVIMQQLDGELLVESLGIAYAVIALLLVRFVRRERGGFGFRELSFALLLFAACLTLSLAVPYPAPIVAGLAGAIPLLSASGLELRSSRRRLGAAGKGSPVQ